MPTCQLSKQRLAIANNTHERRSRKHGTSIKKVIPRRNQGRQIQQGLFRASAMVTRHHHAISRGRDSLFLRVGHSWRAKVGELLASAEDFLTCASQAKT